MDLVNSRMLSQVDLPPAPLPPEFPDSLAELDTHIEWHPLSIDLVDALYLVDTLFCSDARRLIAIVCARLGRLEATGRAAAGKPLQVAEKSEEFHKREQLMV